MAACFDFSFKLLTVFIVITKLRACSTVYTVLSCDFTAVLANDTIDFRSNDSVFAASPVLLWSRPPGCVPYRPTARSSAGEFLISTLLLSGDIEINPGPPITHGFNLGYINAQSLKSKTAVVHSLIDELKLHCLAITESWIKACLLYTSPSPRDGLLSRMPSSA